LRTTAGTLLARSGVMPQEAQRQMRHADIKTTLRHYTDLRLSDQARAVAKLPMIAGKAAVLAPTGTDGEAKNPQHWPQHFAHESGQSGTSGCHPVRGGGQREHDAKGLKNTGKNASVRGHARRNKKAGDRDR